MHSYRKMGQSLNRVYHIEGERSNSVASVASCSRRRRLVGGWVSLVVVVRRGEGLVVDPVTKEFWEAVYYWMWSLTRRENEFAYFVLAWTFGCCYIV
jgi:hypothetical protein